MQCFKVFWTWARYKKEIGDFVDRDINNPVAKMLENGWRIVSTQTNLTEEYYEDSLEVPIRSPYIAVSVLFEKD